MMHQIHPAPQACLGKSEIIDFHSPAVRTKAAGLAAECVSELELIEKTYAFVRDDIAHSIDCGGTAVTCRASDVLRVGEGLCYAKAHLLAALLRANGIATGFCYQLLGLADKHDPQRVLHGLNAVWLADRQRWHRVDARGNKPGVDAQFLPHGPEQLAFAVHPQCGEVDYPHIFAEPDPGVVALLLSPHTPQALHTLDRVLPRLPQGLAR